MLVPDVEEPGSGDPCEQPDSVSCVVAAGVSTRMNKTATEMKLPPDKPRVLKAN